MKKKKWIAGIVSIAAVAAAAAGISAGVRAAGGRPVMVLQASDLNQGGYGGSMSSMEGMVTSDVSQDVYLQDTETVSRVLVQEGDTVREGDVLMEYDTTQTSLNLEREKLNRERIQLNMQTAQENLRKLKNTKPVSGQPSDPAPEFPDIFIPQEPELPEEPGEMPEPTETPAPTPTEDPDKMYTVTLNGNGQGNELPVFQVKTGTSLEAYMNALPEEQWKQYVPAAEGYVFGGWYRDQACTIPCGMKEPVKEDLTLYARWIRQFQAQAWDVLTGKTMPYNPPEEGDAETGTLLNPYRYLVKDGTVVYPSFMNGIRGEMKKILQGEPEAHIYFMLEVREGDSLAGAVKGFFLQDAVKLLDREYPDSWRGVMDASTGTLKDTVAEPAPSGAAAEGTSLRTGSGESGLNLLPDNGSYTKEELQSAIREQEEKLAVLQLDLKEAELKIQNAEKAVQNGVVRAKISGIVKKAGNPDSPPADGSAFLQVTSTDGMYIRGGINELMLGQLKEGDMLSVTAWESGTSCQAEIKEISPYPDESGRFSSYGTASASYYPFIAYVAEGGDNLKNQEWVNLETTEISYDPAGEALYLWKAFILEEDGKKYVYLRDENGKLKKQEITVGRLSSWGEGYEILDGVTWEDWLAFPYGKNVKNGAATREGTMDELYGY